jgi:pentose-5-phosphate-3-epimerase
MSVNPGRQGQPFLLETLKKIEQLRLLGYRNKIFLDGGINEKTIPEILAQKFLPDVLCPGSFLTKADEKDLSKRVDYLFNIIK